MPRSAGEVTNGRDEFLGFSEGRWVERRLYVAMTTGCVTKRRHFEQTATASRYVEDVWRVLDEVDDGDDDDEGW